MRFYNLNLNSSYIMKISNILYNIYSLLILLDLINEFNVYKGVL